MRGLSFTAGARPTKRSANFALGSASSQLQEVLVTNLPRSFNSGERETREGGREREMKGRRTGRGRIEKDRFFNFHCSDTNGSEGELSRKPNKLRSVSYISCEPLSLSSSSSIYYHLNLSFSLVIKKQQKTYLTFL